MVTGGKDEKVIFVGKFDKIHYGSVVNVKRYGDTMAYFYYDKTGMLA